ncbi:LysR family transcriptional regulator, partial [Neobacillus drentensis]|uniref:LysR family transcriptional regulator n=1 Tax=Neobacillus drentensis TaxID=220684 RepID=UPI002FFF04E3
MNIEQFTHIVEVARTKSFFTAAKNLHVTQSAISRSIGNLENELGIKLFNRSRNGTVVSEEGESIIKKANEILIKVQEIKEDVLVHKAVLHDEIRIAASPGLFSSILPKTIASFNKDFPYVKIQVMERSNQDIQEDLLKNKIDFGILPIVYPKIWIENEFIIDPLTQTNLKVIVSKDSPIANRKMITPYDLNNHPFVLYNDNRDIYKALLNDLNKYIT